MGFNQQQFNLSGFNVAGAAPGSIIRILAGRFVFTATRPLLKRSSRHTLRAAAIKSGAALKLTVRAPIKPIPAAIVSSGRVRLAVRRPIQLNPAAGFFRSGRLFLHLYESTAINLSGLVLNPGETLVIDTDKITVEKNGVNVIEFWQTGSRPFMLSNGENVISYYDDNESRMAHLTISWRDRWL